MSATLVSLAHTTSRILNAQQAQFAADASALSCALFAVENSRDFATSIAEQNQASVTSLELDENHCVVTVRSREVQRRAVAWSVNRSDLPTLQR